MKERDPATLEAVEAFLWYAPERARAAVAALPRESMEQRAFAAVCAYRLACLLRQPRPDLQAARWRCWETGAPELIGFATFPFVDNIDPEAELKIARRAWERVRDLADDPIAWLVWQLVGDLYGRRQRSPELVAHIGQAFWDRREAWAVLGAQGARLMWMHALTQHDQAAMEVWVDRATPYVENQLGRVAANQLGFRAQRAWVRGDHDDGLDLAARAMAAAPDATASTLYFDMLRVMGRLDEAIEGLERFVATTAGLDDAMPRVRLALALQQRGCHERVREVLDGARSIGGAKVVAMRQLLRAAIGDVEGGSAPALQEAARSLPPDEDIATLLAQAAVQQGLDPAASTRLRCCQLELLHQLGRSEEVAGVVAGHEEDARIVGPYDLQDPIGAGANATVFVGRHHATGMTAAVKLLASPTDGSLRDEARVLARMRHPNVLAVFDLGRVTREEALLSRGQLEAHTAWMAMEHVDGGTLAGCVGRLDWPRLKPVVLALLDGLGHAHGAGVLHLDIKPANVLLVDGPDGWIPKLADFGVFTLLQGTDRARVAGTPAYMAPEQWSGQRNSLTAATDLYALGCTIYELLAGRPPFQAPTFAALRELHRTAPRPPIDASTELATWLHRLMAIEPAKRFRSSAEAAEAFLHLEAPRLPVAEVPVEQQATAAFAPVQTSMDPLLLRQLSERVPTGRVPAVDLRSPPAISPLLPPALALASMDVGVLPGLQEIQEGLWHALAHTARHQARVVRLEGPGSVRTLMRWLVRQARSAGIAAHLLDAEDPTALEQQLSRSIAGRSAFRPADAGDPLEALLGDLGSDTSVLAIVPRPKTLATLESWVARLGMRPCLVVASRWASPAQRIAVPRLRAAEVVTALQDRIPLQEDAAAAIAERASGDLDAAFAILDQRQGQLRRVLYDWTLPDLAELGSSDDVLVQRARRLLVTDPELARRLGMASLAGRSIPRSDAERVEGLVDADGRVLAPVGAILEVEASARPDVVEEALSLVRDPFREARLLALLGRRHRALKMLLQLAKHSLYARPARCRAALEAACELELPLPGAYFMERGRLAHRDGLSEEARHYLRLASDFPETRTAADYQLHFLQSGPQRSQALRKTLLDAQTDPVMRSDLLCRIAIDAFLYGDRAVSDQAFADAVEAISPERHVMPHCARLWCRLPLDPDETWMAEAERLVERANGRDVDGAAGLIASALVIWGELERARQWIDGRPALFTIAVELLLDIAQQRPERASERLHGPFARLFEGAGWTWAVHWWLAADAPDGRWAETRDRYPQCRCLPAATWVLLRAADRTSRVDRKLELQRTFGR